MLFIHLFSHSFSFQGRFAVIGSVAGLWSDEVGHSAWVFFMGAVHSWNPPRRDKRSNLFDSFCRTYGIQMNSWDKQATTGSLRPQASA